MRILTFLSVFLVVAILVVGSIFWINRDTFLAVFQNRPALLEGSEWVQMTYSLGGLVAFMAEQPQHATLLSVPFPEDAQDDATFRAAAGESIRYRSDLMYPAGSLSDLMLVITYADQVTSGVLDPATPIDAQAVAAFHIPGLDRRHQRNFHRWKADLPAPPAAADLVRYLLTHNDPAAADYLFFFLGTEEVARHTVSLGEGLIELPVPRFGLRMTALERPEGQTLGERLAELEAIDRTDFAMRAVALAKQQWDRPEPVSETSITAFQDQRALHGLYPRLQPDRFASLLAKIWQGTLLGEETSRTLRQLLEHEPDDRRLEDHVRWYAAQFDERMSYMSGWTVAGKTNNTGFRVQVMLTVDVPAGLWFHMNSNFMIRDFHNRMLHDTALRSRTYDLLM